MKHSLIASLLSLAVAAGCMIPLAACEAHNNESSEAETPHHAEAIPAPRADGLEIQDVKVGDGQAAQAGDLVSVNYLGTLANNGEKFDSSYDRNEPFQFQLGAGQVIEGWEKGIEGMKVGGKRILVIPSKMAYGEAGAPPVIPPNATLKFEVELLDVQ